MSNKSNRSDTPPQKQTPRLWRRRRYQVAAVVAALVAVAGFAANAFLAKQYAPEGAVSQYLSALESGDATGAWSVAQVAAPGKAVSVVLTDEAALRSALGAGRPDLKSFDITGTSFLDADQTLAAVDVTYETSSGTKQTKFRLERGAEKHFGVYPRWHVLIQPVLLSLELPSRAGGVAVDGKPVALKGGQSTLAVWPLAHKILFQGTAMLEPGTSTVDAFASTAESVAYKPTLTAAGLAKASAAIRSAFDNCTQQTAFQPAGCPQSFNDAYGGTGQWELVGDPTQDLEISFDQDQNLIGTGHFQMVVAFQQSGTDGTLHFPSGAGYSASLGLDSSDITVTSITSTRVVRALQRPAAVSDQVVKDLLTKAFAACAAARSGSPADCPQQYLFPDAQGIRWTLNGDPLSAASVRFDPNSGLFTVPGSFDMTASYSLRGYPYSHPSYTTAYDAYLFWDGHSLQLVTIAGSYA